MPDHDTGGPPASSAYGLDAPGLADAARALRRVHRDAAPAGWEGLLRRAGLTGRETDDGSLARLLAVMATADPVTALCGRALTIRRVSHRKLAAVHTTIRSAE